MPLDPAATRRARLLRPRWHGGRGRSEVWYATATLPATGHGVWIHAELLARTDGRAEAHGWAALFPPDGPPLLERFGPRPVGAPRDLGDRRGVDVAGARFTPARLSGTAGDLAWDLVYRDAGPPLHPFSATAWERGLLPGAQVVPAPTARLAGVVRVGADELPVEDAPGAVARIAGRGNPERWAWLHADLGGDDVLEVVAARAHQPLLRRIPPRVFAQLRTGGVDRPVWPLLAAVPSAADLGLPEWRVSVPTGWGQRLRVEVCLPGDRTVTVAYTDPDGAPATCTNSCRADADVVLERRTGRRWRTERSWTLRGTAHAEVGDRPPS